MKAATDRPGKRKWRTAAVLTGLGGAAAAALVPASPAAAGTNGQEVFFEDANSNHVQACGYNQNHKHVCTPWFYTSHGAPGGAVDVYLTGYWWIGKVWVYGYDASAAMTCSVSKSNPYGVNWYYCGWLS